MTRTLLHRYVEPRTRLSGRRGPGPRPCGRTRKHRPSLEFLEDRVTPATFLVVNSLDNNLPGSLR
jgi:hypothetical protein